MFHDLEYAVVVRDSHSFVHVCADKASFIPLGSLGQRVEARVQFFFLAVFICLSEIQSKQKCTCIFTFLLFLPLRCLIEWVLVFSTCVAAVKSRPVLHHCVVIFFWSSGIMECTCMLFTFKNGVLFMR